MKTSKPDVKCELIVEYTVAFHRLRPAQHPLD